MIKVVKNSLLDGNLELGTFVSKFHISVTSAQLDEINKCKEPRRSELLNLVRKLSPSQSPLQTAVWGYFRWGEVPWGLSTAGHYEVLFSHLDQLKLNNRGNTNDALIAEVCIVENIALVTCDKALFEALTSVNKDLAILFRY